MKHLFGFREPVLIQKRKDNLRSSYLYHVSLFIIEKGYLDDVPVNEVSSFEAALHDAMSSSAVNLLNKINESGELDKSSEAELISVIEDFKSTGSW